MTPDQYREDVLPVIRDRYFGRCICHHQALRKLMSFRFEDYTIGPLALADTEILIHHLIHQSTTIYNHVVDETDGRT